MTARSDLKKHIRARQAKTGESYTTARLHVLRARSSDSPTASPPPERETSGIAESSDSGAHPDGAIDKAQPERTTGVVLKCNDKSLRLRIRGEEGSVTLRCSTFDARRVAPAQHVEITVSKRWTWRSDAYASGEVKRAWTDIAALDLEPLPLEDQGLLDLNERYEPFVPPEPYAELWAFFASTPRTAYEFDGIAWGAGVGVDPHDTDACIVADAAEISQWDPPQARELLMDAVLADPRCIDAHVHLGNLVFEHRPEDAITHYQIAVAIGDLSLGPDFSGLLPWGYLYNRPMLRALHGYGLCLWRLGRSKQAREVFGRILSLNPADNQGVRTCWNDIRNGRPWTPDGIEEDYSPAETVH